MSFSYNPNLTSDLDKVRLAIGDTDSTNPLFSDEEINAQLAIYGSVLETAATFAESAAAKYARMVNISVDGLSTSYSDLARNFANLAERLRARAAEELAGLGVPVVNGISVSEMQAVDENQDRVPSQFKVGQFDNPPHEGGGDGAVPDLPTGAAS